MSTLAPASLLVRPSTGVVMHSLIEANPAVPLSYEPDLPELFRHCLQVCRDLERAVTVAELAARMSHSPAVVGVVIAELADVDLVRLVSAPARAERLRTWATGTRPVPVAASLIKMLIVSTEETHIHQALVSLAGAEPWPLQGWPRIQITTTRIAEDLDMLALGVSGLGNGSPVWSDVYRDVFGAVIVTGTTPQELTTAQESLRAVNAADVPTVLLVHQVDEDEVNTDVVRASVALPPHTPLVIGDVQGPGVCEAIMDLCSVLMSGGGR